MMPATSRPLSPHRVTGIPSGSPARGIFSVFTDLSSPGYFFIIMLFITEQWRRIVPQSWLVVLQAWNTWVHYATFQLPAEPNGFYGYNALQQIAYFAAVFLFGPVAILTGVAMSPAVVNRFSWYARLFGGRQSARSIHFVTMLCFVAFIGVHVTLVVMTGFARNMNHIVMGTDIRIFGNNAGARRHRFRRFFLDCGSLFLLVYPRVLQHVQKFITYPL